MTELYATGIPCINGKNANVKNILFFLNKSVISVVYSSKYDTHHRNRIDVEHTFHSIHFIAAY